MHEVDFYRLSRAVQDRFIASAAGQGEPRPLLQARAPRDVRVGWWAAAGVLCALAAAGIVALGFGRLDSSLARQSTIFLGAYAATLGGAAWCWLEAIALRRRRTGLPFAARTYLFPIGVIDARSRLLGSYHLDPQTRWEHAGSVFRIHFGGAQPRSFAFTLRDAERAGYIDRGLRAAQERMSRAAATGDPKLLRALDPLVDIGVVNPFAPTTAHPASPPRWISLRYALAPLVGVVLAFGLWMGRNAASDAVMLGRARRESTAGAYRAYLASGGRSALVRDVLLPRAELADVVRAGGIAAIERFGREHPGSSIQPDIDAALRSAMLRELEVAKAQGTVAELREFARAHPTDHIAAELNGAIHAVYQRALLRYRSEAPKDPQVLSFVERLLAYLERQGPLVQVSFRRKASRTMSAADRSVKKSPFFMGTPSLPSQYFDERRARARERLVATALKERFAASFSPDILSVELGPPMPEGEAVPAVKVPTIFIEHAAEVSGGSYLSTNPRGVFVGLGLIFDVTFRIPNDAGPHKFRLSAWRPPDIHAARKDDAFEATVYDTMATTGYVQFAERYSAAFFSRERPRAHNDRL